VGVQSDVGEEPRPAVQIDGWDDGVFHWWEEERGLRVALVQLLSPSLGGVHVLGNQLEFQSKLIA
jgi:hypothetical protein